MTTLPAMHTLWIHEIRTAFRPACTEDASVWDRAKAVTYLRERFVPRFRAERDAASSLVALLQPTRGTALWAAASLVEAHAERIARLATFHQKADEFRTASEDLVLALEEWCSALDMAAEHMREADLHLV